MNIFLFLIIIFIFGEILGTGCFSFNTSSNTVSQNSDSLFKHMNMSFVNLSDAEWRRRLTPEQYHVLRQKGTERPFTGKYYVCKEKGVYCCAGCGLELFTHEMKFDSPCGWPSFDKEIEGGRIIKKPDHSHGMIRTEILCARCGGHLGHLFDDGPTETGLRYCVNSVSLDFRPEHSASSQEK